MTGQTINQMCSKVHDESEMKQRSSIDWIKVSYRTQHNIGHALPAHLSASTQKTKSKPEETTTKNINKPGLTHITKSNTSNHASGMHRYYNTK